MADNRPLSMLVGQGWEIVGYSGGSDAKSGLQAYSVLLRRQKQHKILQLRNKWLGRGQVATEIDL